MSLCTMCTDVGFLLLSYMNSSHLHCADDSPNIKNKFKKTLLSYGSIFLCFREKSIPFLFILWLVYLFFQRSPKCPRITSFIFDLQSHSNEINKLLNYPPLKTSLIRWRAFYRADWRHLYALSLNRSCKTPFLSMQYRVPPGDTDCLTSVTCFISNLSVSSCHFTLPPPPPSLFIYCKMVESNFLIYADKNCIKSKSSILIFYKKFLGGNVINQCHKFIDVFIYS